MAKVENLEKLVKALRDRAAKAKDANASVLVGYAEGEIGLYVHENRGMKLKGKPRPSGLGVYWGPRGRAGFLLDVMREVADELRTLITGALVKGRTMAQALIIGGLRLQRESMQNVPVEYGNLRASAFTRLEGGVATQPQAQMH